MLPVQLAALIPVKAFSAAKQRLAGTLRPEQRALLARWMAARVVAAAGTLPVFIVCDDDEVATWASDAGADVLWRPGHGLNPAVLDGVRTLADKGYDHAVISHSDLPLAYRLDRLAVAGEITLVPDHRDDGTNVIALPTAVEFEFAYGARSFDRHVIAAVATGLPYRVIRDERLGRDVDTPEDLDHPLIKEHLPSLPTNPDSPR
jgi:2-phospho-L-lactate guanylyltransferase